MIFTALRGQPFFVITCIDMLTLYYRFFRELDHAMLRRLEKRILVDLPTLDARKAMFKHHLPRIVNPSEGGLEMLSDLDYDLLAAVSNLSERLYV